jgi:alpha-beta hydrolase superfamily lysophospholipase
MNRRGVLRAGFAATATTLGACAPTVQRAMQPLPDFNGSRFEKDAFVSFDGARLGLSVWSPPETIGPWAVVIGLHGQNDYANTYALAGPYWAERGILTYAYDARGHGRSPRRGDWPGQFLLVEDLRTACAVARRRHPGALLAVVGESMGAATAIAAFGSPAPPDADRLVLAAPAVWGWSELPDFYALTLWLGAHTLPRRRVTAPRAVVRRIRPTDNIELLRALGRDRLMIFETRIDAIYGLVTLMETASQHTGGLRLPSIYLYGAHDQIIPLRASLNAASRLPEAVRTAFYANGYHMLLRDLQANVVFEDIVCFLRDPAGPLPSRAPPLLRRRRRPLIAEGDSGRTARD